MPQLLLLKISQSAWPERSILYSILNAARDPDPDPDPAGAGYDDVWIHYNLIISEHAHLILAVRKKIIC